MRELPVSACQYLNGSCRCSLKECGGQVWCMSFSPVLLLYEEVEVEEGDLHLQNYNNAIKAL